MTCRVHAPKTAKLLFGFLGLTPVAQSREEVALAVMPIMPAIRLRDYVKNRANCYLCGSQVLLKISKKQKIYYKCGYCQKVGGLPVDLLDNYLIKMQLRCSKCAGFFEARISKYGVYAKCSSCDEKIDVRALW